MATTDQLNGLDSVFLYLESTRTPMHVGGVAIYNPKTSAKKTVTFSDIIDFVSQRVHLAKPFRKKLSFVPLEMDYPYWIDDPDFDIRNHIREYKLPEPGNWHQLCELAASLFAKPLDLNAPVWEFAYISGLNSIEGVPKGSFAILSKAHHCAIDGASGVDIATATHTMQPKVGKSENLPVYHPEKGPNPIRKFRRAIRRTLMQPVITTRSVAKLMPRLSQVIVRDIGNPMSKPSFLVPMTRFNKDVSNRRAFGGVSLPFKDVQAFRALVEGSTVNDVVLAIVGGAMRHYLEAYGEIGKKPLIAMTPLAIKSKARDAAKTGNSVANMLVELGTHLSDPVERLAYVHQSAGRAKKTITKIGPERMSAATKVMPPLIASLSFRSYTVTGTNRLNRPNSNTVVTNVPGPNVPIYFCGSELVTQYNMAPLHHGMGLVHTVFTYCGTMTIGLNACAHMLPDIRVYEETLEHSIASLKASLKEISETKK